MSNTPDAFTRVSTQTSAELESLWVPVEPPRLGPQSRPGTRSVQEVERQAREFCRRHALDGERAELLRCVLLLWHDHLEPAHKICQDASTGTGAWLHGHMHRREPDYSNAKYWFRRVGTHPASTRLVAMARPLVDEGDRALQPLLARGTWDAFAFVDACAAAEAAGDNDPKQAPLRQLQAVELRVLAESLLDQSADEKSRR